MLKVIKGKTIEEQIQSIDILINSLFERRYSLAVDLIPKPIPQPMPISIKVLAGMIGDKVFPIAGKITKLTCTSLKLPKDTIINVTVNNNNQSITTKFALPSSKIQETELDVPVGAEVEIELIPPLENNICIGLVFVPDNNKKEDKA